MDEWTAYRVTWADREGQEHEAIQIPWPVVTAWLGRPHTGSADDDREMRSVLRVLGAPAWIDHAVRWTDDEGWGLIGAALADIPDA